MPPGPPQPLLELSYANPGYLWTNVLASGTIALNVASHRYHDDADPRLLAQKEVVIESYPGCKPVAGTWRPPRSIQTSIYFEPAAPLAPGDYLIRVPNAGSDLVVRPRPFNLFRVGSLLRVAHIEIHGDKPSAPHDLLRLDVGYSERLPEGLAGSVEIKQQQAGGAWTTLAGTTSYGTEVRLAQPLDPTKLLRVTISAPGLDTGSGRGRRTRDLSSSSSCPASTRTSRGRYFTTLPRPFRDHATPGDLELATPKSESRPPANQRLMRTGLCLLLGVSLRVR